MAVTAGAGPTGSRRGALGCVLRGLMGWSGVALLGATLPTARAQDVTDASVKAAYLYKFLSYVEWPAEAFASSEAPLVIGVWRADEVWLALQQVIAGRQFNGRPLLARRISGSEPGPLHVLFIGGEVDKAAAGSASPSGPVLVVTEASRRMPEHSALNFVTVRQRIRFEASPAAAERAGLKLSSRLLGVAERVVSP